MTVSVIPKMREPHPEFEAVTPKRWTGRYARVPGTSTTFHLRQQRRQWWPVVEWRIDDERATCPMVWAEAAESLADAVQAAKRRARTSGGSFAINEFGQVLVPTAEDSERCLLAGRWSGPLRFENAFEDGRQFDLCDARGLKPGCAWNRPYVGMPYKISADRRIAFTMVSGTRERTVYADQQDEDLITGFERIRGPGGGRILVAPAGIVLTKAPPASRISSEDGWQAVYVGRISIARWFHEQK